MEVVDFLESINQTDGFFCGVPDSQLKALCDYLSNNKEFGKNNIIAANEGNCTAIAAGYYLATGRFPVVYLQNSGIGNIINPVASLLNDNVYGIPCIFIVGWRGEPNTHDEPQHVFQGAVTLQLLKDMDISTMVVTDKTSVDELKSKMDKFNGELNSGKSVAFVIGKKALSYSKNVTYSNNNSLLREEVIEHIVDIAREDIIVSTTGKASRELFEIREKNKQSHCYDFLTVGSMGHSSSISYGIALQKTKHKVWCIEGDGSALMHLGAMAVIGAGGLNNLIHVVINNEAHESVGGMPTVANKVDLVAIAKGCGYVNAISINSIDELDRTLEKIRKNNVLSFVEVKARIGSRPDLGRPTTSAQENKNNFMNYLKELE